MYHVTKQDVLGKGLSGVTTDVPSQAHINFLPSLFPIVDFILCYFLLCVCKCVFVCGGDMGQPWVVSRVLSAILLRQGVSWSRTQQVG